MPQANLTDVQQVVFTIPNGQNGVNVAVTHHLQDQNGNHLTPDEINVEPVNHVGNNMLATGGVIFYRVRSTPEDGTVTIRMDTAVNASGGDWVTTCRVTSKYIHSIQSNDHTV